MRIRVGLKGTFQPLQFKVELLGDLCHGRRGIVRDLHIVVELGGLQLRQIHIRVLGEHGEYQAPAIARVVDDQCLLERHHAGIVIATLHQHAAMQVISNAQRLQRAVLERVTKHQASGA